MDWTNRWFLCKACGQCIRKPSAFWNHKKDKCKGRNVTSGSCSNGRRFMQPGSINPRHQQPSSKGNSGVIDIRIGRERERKLKCNFCHYITNSQSNFQRHLRIHLTEKLFVCNLCDFVCRTPATLKKHSRYHTGETPFKCEECPASFNTPTARGRHISRQHPPEDENQLQNPKEKSNVFTAAADSTSKKFKCVFCGYATSNGSILINHIRTHTGVKPFVCKLCNYACKQRSSLTAHRRFHAGETPFKCSECPATFNTRYSLGHHFARQHEERGPEETEPFVRKSSKGESKTCRFCSKVLSSVCNKQQHELIHTGEKPFKCSKCSARFTDKSTLKKHMLTHEATKRFKCNFCNYGCHQKHHLAAHARIHTGERPYKCNLCDAAFIQSTYLKAHLDFHHHNIKNYKCQLCKFATTFMSSLKRHIRIHKERL